MAPLSVELAPVFIITAPLETPWELDAPLSIIIFPPNLLNELPERSRMSPPPIPEPLEILIVPPEEPLVPVPSDISPEFPSFELPVTTEISPDSVIASPELKESRPVASPPELPICTEPLLLN